MPKVTVYALLFESGKIYIAITADLARRLEEHRRRQSPSTKRFSGGFTVIYTEETANYVEARRREKYLKSGPGRQSLRASGRGTS